jgi:hypothetical protein
LRIGKILECAEENNGHPEIRFEDRLCELDPRHDRHPDVAEDHVDRRGTNHVEGDPSVFRRADDLEADLVPRKEKRQSAPDVLFVVYNEQAIHGDVTSARSTASSPIDPFTNAVGKTSKYIDNPIGIFNIVPVFSKNADLVVMYLDWMAQIPNMTKIIYGNEGQHHSLNQHGIAPVRIANPPESLSKLGPMLLDKAEEFIKRIIMAKPSEFDALYDSLLKEWLDMGARQVKEDMLKQYDAEHK